MIAGYRKLAKLAKESFNKKFYNAETKCLEDVLGDKKIRPNQLYALSVSYPVMDVSSAEAKSVFDTVTKKLLNKEYIN